MKINDIEFFEYPEGYDHSVCELSQEVIRKEEEKKKREKEWRRLSEPKRNEQQLKRFFQ